MSKKTWAYLIFSVITLSLYFAYLSGPFGCRDEHIVFTYPFLFIWSIATGFIISEKYFSKSNSFLKFIIGICLGLIMSFIVAKLAFLVFGIESLSGGCEF